MTPRLLLTLLFPALAGLSACSSTRHCERATAYQEAETVAPLQPVDGIQPPSSPSALRIPPPPAEIVPFALREEDPDKPGRTRVRCLDLPPAIAPQHLVIPEEGGETD